MVVCTVNGTDVTTSSSAGPSSSKSVTAVIAPSSVVSRSASRNRNSGAMSSRENIHSEGRRYAHLGLDAPASSISSRSAVRRSFASATSSRPCSSPSTLLHHSSRRSQLSGVFSGWVACQTNLAMKGLTSTMESVMSMRWASVGSATRLGSERRGARSHWGYMNSAVVVLARRTFSSGGSRT